jgi:hypothetical protein
MSSDEQPPDPLADGPTVSALVAPTSTTTILAPSSAERPLSYGRT